MKIELTSETTATHAPKQIVFIEILGFLRGQRDLFLLYKLNLSKEQNLLRNYFEAVHQLSLQFFREHPHLFKPQQSHLTWDGLEDFETDNPNDETIVSLSTSVKQLMQAYEDFHEEFSEKLDCASRIMATHHEFFTAGIMNPASIVTLLDTLKQSNPALHSKFLEVSERMANLLTEKEKAQYRDLMAGKPITKHKREFRNSVFQATADLDFFLKENPHFTVVLANNESTYTEIATLFKDEIHSQRARTLERPKISLNLNLGIATRFGEDKKTEKIPDPEYPFDEKMNPDNDELPNLFS